MEIILLIAVDNNGVMGKNNKLPWRLSNDLKHFKKETLNYPLIMGSNTFKSLPGVLPNREHLVLSNTLYGDQNYSVFTSIKEVIEYCNESKYDKVYVIGGANLINQFAQMNMFTEMIITHVNCIVDGDTIIDLDKTLHLHKWSVYDTENYIQDENNEYSFSIKKYKKTLKRFY